MPREALSHLEPYVTDGAKIMLRIFLAAAAFIFLVNALMMAAFPYPLDYGEAPLVDQAVRLADGENIYRPDLSTPPYTITNYPPLYVLALAPFTKLGAPTFLPGRLISLLSTFVTAVFLGLIVQTLTKERLAAVTAGLIFLAIRYVAHWAALLRIDMLALAFSAAALYVLARWPASRRGLVGGALLLLTAVYTRQSYGLAAPLAAFAWLWAQQGWRRALELALLVGGLGLIIFLVLNIITNGGFFYNVVTANVNEFGWERLDYHLNNLWDTLPILLIFGGVFLLLGWRRLPYWSLPAFYLLGAALSALTIGKIGANVNYFLELAAALSLAAGLLLAWSRPHPWWRILILVLMVWQIGLTMQATLIETVSITVARRLDTDAIRQLAQRVQDAKDPILADEYMGLLTMQKQPLYLQPFEVTQLANAGLWDQTPLLESIRAQAFPLILIHHFEGYPVYKERWTPEMLDAIYDAYRPIVILADTVIYAPPGR